MHSMTIELKSCCVVLVACLGLVGHGFALGAEQMRPKLIAEEFYVPDNATETTTERIWEKLLLALNIPEFSPRDSAGGYGYGSSACHYDQAIVVLNKIRVELGQSSPYQKIWALNQDRVFSACDGRSQENTPPIRPGKKNQPKRAESDYFYQLASWHFYKREYDQALPIYRRVERMKGASQRANAAYMVVRTLAYLDQAVDAYRKVGEILADSSLKEVHEIAANYRFVIMSNSSYIELSIPPELAKDHLNWLLRVVRVNPEKSSDLERAFKDYSDAMQQLDVYFPIYDEETKSIDWWLMDGDLYSPRMQAVKSLAPTNGMVDWMQAKWAYNVFDSDWLWALHDSSNPYWAQNHNIVKHAWDRWESEQNGSWLQIAIKRVHPNDPLAEKIVEAANIFLIRGWTAETPEYREWLFDLWENSIRINLGSERFPQAFALISGHEDFSELLQYSHSKLRYTGSHGLSLEKSLRWLVYIGKVDEARLCLSLILKLYPHQFRQWRTLLATDASEAIVSAIKQDSYYDNSIGNSQIIWQEMVNLLPMHVLYKFATNPEVDENYRPLLARVLLTRAILLGVGNSDVDRYAALAAKLNPSMREKILRSVSLHDADKYISFLLEMPRFRPVPFLEYARNLEKNEGDAIAIDKYNHNDNNWWCRFDREQLENRIFHVALINLAPSKVLRDKEIIDPYFESQRVMLTNHPYRALIDYNEIEALEKVPSGPQYLSEKVNARERATFWRFLQSEEVRNERAADLHRAVRSTRYGCNRDGSHGVYSRESFSLLHRFYKDTSWAKATPYWFE